MYSNGDDPGTIPDGGAGGYTAPSLSAEQIDQLLRERDELLNYRNRAEDYFTRLEPHKDRVKRLLEDEQAPRVFDDGLAAYEAVRERSKPKLPPEWDVDQNPFLRRMAAVADYVEDLKKREGEYTQRSETEQQQRVVAEAAAVSEQLIKELPHLADDNFAGIQAIAAYARANNLPFKAAVDKLMPVLRPKAAEPPRSLRASSGAPGVPQRSEKPSEDTRSLFEITRDRLNADRQKRGA